MTCNRNAVPRWVTACIVLLFWIVPQVAWAQETEADEKDKKEEVQVAEEITVTGSRIRKNPLNEPAPVLELQKEDLERSGLTNLGATLQQLPVMGSAINTRFNVPGNSGFPQDGTGIGAGAVQLSLRNIGAKRTLVLVDGKRWIAGASASGVPVAVDLNTLPANAIKRIEVLQDGASAIYGSDAIGGVVNIITEDNFDGFKFDYHQSEFLSFNDGKTNEASILWGGGNEKSRFTVSLSFAEERDVFTSDRAQSAFPSPFGDSCLDGGCSSFTPQGRFILGPNFDFADLTLNNGVLNDGGFNIPMFDPNNPTGGDFHGFSAADRFNFNGPGFNYLATPNQRVNLFINATHKINDNLRLVAKASYTNRQSRTQAAPEPLCFGAGCGNRISENIVIDADQIYNPFGVDLSVADGTLEFFGRRPLESGPRIFDQDINTYFGTMSLEGNFATESGRFFSWDLNLAYGDNRGFQQKHGAHNMARIAIALGDPALCAATPNCVPFNLFGGQGPDGTGSITPEMLNYISYVQRDFSEQTLVDFSGNITGDLVHLPAGKIAFAAGFEYRKHDGSFQPDPVAQSGETAGIPSGATAGAFDVTEFYGEVNIPLALDSPGLDYLEFNLAGRTSDYSNFGNETTYKAGTLWRPVRDLSLRASVSTGIRAPGIGELFGGAAREDFTFLDPCADVFGVIGAANGGRDSAQSQQIIDNCGELGLPPELVQRNPQLSAISAGNESLTAETSDNLAFGLVWSPSFVKNVDWADRLTLSLDFYDLEIDNAVQGRDPGDLIDACVNTLDPFFCDAVERTANGNINLVDNQLQNIGGIEASGYDLSLGYAGPLTRAGSFGFVVNTTVLDEYIELTSNPDGSLTRNDRTGTITDETFQRAFPEKRLRASVNWNFNGIGADLTWRYVDSMTMASGNELDSAVFTDLQFRYRKPVGGNMLSLVVGANNVLDEDPPTCDACGVIGMSPVVHDIPGRVGYVRLAWQM